MESRNFATQGKNFRQKYAKEQYRVYIEIVPIINFSLFYPNLMFKESI